METLGVYAVLRLDLKPENTMAVQESDYFILAGLIADPDTIRRRLATAATEVDILKAMLKVSKRLEAERERLKEQNKS